MKNLNLSLIFILISAFATSPVFSQSPNLELVDDDEYHLTPGPGLNGFGMCSDGRTYGYKTFEALYQDIMELNSKDDNTGSKLYNESPTSPPHIQEEDDASRHRNRLRKRRHKVGKEEQLLPPSPNNVRRKTTANFAAIKESFEGVINDYDDLDNGTSSFLVEGREKPPVFTLCPNTVFTIQAPLTHLLIRSSLELKCGSRGNLVDECVLMGRQDTEIIKIGPSYNSNTKPFHDFNAENNGTGDTTFVQKDNNIQTMIIFRGISFLSDLQTREDGEMQPFRPSIDSGDDDDDEEGNAFVSMGPEIKENNLIASSIVSILWDKQDIINEICENCADDEGNGLETQDSDIYYNLDGDSNVLDEILADSNEYYSTKEEIGNKSDIDIAEYEEGVGADSHEEAIEEDGGADPKQNAIEGAGTEETLLVRFVGCQFVELSAESIIDIVQSSLLEQFYINNVNSTTSGNVMYDGGLIDNSSWQTSPVPSDLPSSQYVEDEFSDIEIPTRGNYSSPESIDGDGRRRQINSRLDKTQNSSSNDRNGVLNNNSQRKTLESLNGWSNHFRIIFEETIFTRNIASQSIISNHGGHLTLKGATFSGNIAKDGSIVTVNDGQFSIADTCFKENKYDTSVRGIVKMDANSYLSENENNYLSGNGSYGTQNGSPGILQCDGVMLDRVGFYCEDNDPDCDGQGQCEKFDAIVCGKNDIERSPFRPILCSDGSTYGYDDLGMLNHDLEFVLDSVYESIFVLCPHSTFYFKNEDKSDSALRILSHNVTFKCGNNGVRRNKCIFEGGRNHIRLTAGDFHANFFGITMKSATEASVIAEGGSNSLANFIDCSWEDNFGEATIIVKGFNNNLPEEQGEVDDLLYPDDVLVDSGTSMSSADDDLFTRYLRNEGNLEIENTISLENCLFLRNTASTGILVFNSGHSYVVRSSFISNTALGSLVENIGGYLSLSHSCFEENTHDAAKGVVYIDANSFLVTNENNYESNNGWFEFDGSASTGDSCTSVFIQSNFGGYCDNFNNTSCSSQDVMTTFGPSLCSDGLTTGYSDLTKLRNDIHLVEPQGLDPTTFVLCPFSTFHFDSNEKKESGGKIDSNEDDDTSIRFSSNFRISCGTDGASTNLCTFQGGRTHIRISDEVSIGSFSGIAMTGATETSVLLESKSKSTLSFMDCSWKNNAGKATLKVTDLNTEVPLYMEDLFSSGHSADQNMTALSGGIEDQSNHSVLLVTVNFRRCSFLDNSAEIAVISNHGAKLSIVESFFKRNLASKTIVQVLAGSLSLTASCFEDNMYDLSSGVLFLDRNSLIDVLINNFGSENGKFEIGDVSDFDSCNGVFVDSAEGRCITFDNDICLAFNCFEDWKNLSTAVSKASHDGFGGTFVLCPNTLFNLETLSEFEAAPIVIESSNIVIQCGKNGLRASNCIVYGGSEQFKVKGSPVGVRFSGLTMIGSNRTSVIAAGNKNAAVSFFECEWAGHVGSTVVQIYIEESVEGGIDNSIPIFTKENLTFPPKPDTLSMSVDFHSCTFSNNVVTTSVIANFAGDLSIRNSDFLGNKAKGGIILIMYSGILSLIFSCFVDNIADTSGSIYIENDGSSMSLYQENFGLNNIAGTKSCQDTYIAGYCPVEGSCEYSCMHFEAPICKSAPITKMPKPSDSALDCFDDWSKLANAINMASSNRQGKVFIICPNSFFNLNTFPDENAAPVVIEASDTVIQCGNIRLVESSCVIFGGRNVFRIFGSPTGVRFEGLTMVASSGISVIASGNQNAEALFFNCEWAGHSGLAVVEVLHESSHEKLDGDSDVTYSMGDDGMSSSKPSNASMTVRFQHCIFSDNVVTSGIISNTGGVISITGTKFLGTRFVGENTERADILVLLGGVLSMEYSCFVDKFGEPLGSIYLDQYSSLSSNTHNFSTLRSSDTEKSCKDIYFQQPGNQLSKLCVDYTSSSCELREIQTAYDMNSSSTIKESGVELCSDGLTHGYTTFKALHNDIAALHKDRNNFSYKNGIQFSSNSQSHKKDHLPNRNRIRKKRTRIDEPSHRSIRSTTQTTSALNDIENTIPVFTLCPNTTFTIQPAEIHLQINTSLELKCGISGKRENECIMKGQGMSLEVDARNHDESSLQPVIVLRGINFDSVFNSRSEIYDNKWHTPQNSDVNLDTQKILFSDTSPEQNEASSIVYILAGSSNEGISASLEYENDVNSETTSNERVPLVHFVDCCFKDLSAKSIIDISTTPLKDSDYDNNDINEGKGNDFGTDRNRRHRRINSRFDFGHQWQRRHNTRSLGVDKGLFESVELSHHLEVLSGHDYSVVVMLERTTFARNIASQSIVSNHGGHLTLIGAKFSGNTVKDGNIVTVKDGQFSIVDTCFNENKYNTSVGAIVKMDANSYLSENENNYLSGKAIEREHLNQDVLKCDGVMLDCGDNDPDCDGHGQCMKFDGLNCPELDGTNEQKEAATENSSPTLEPTLLFDPISHLHNSSLEDNTVVPEVTSNATKTSFIGSSAYVGTIFACVVVLFVAITAYGLCVSHNDKDKDLLAFPLYPEEGYLDEEK